jgi:hypothetical protein
VLSRLQLKNYQQNISPSQPPRRREAKEVLKKYCKKFNTLHDPLPFGEGWGGAYNGKPKRNP